MSNLLSSVVFMFAVSIVFQVFGIAMLPLTKGLTQPMPTLGLAVGFLVGIGLMARLIHSGVSLSMLIPIMAATVPLASIVLGVVVYGEVASLAKITMLVTACGLIGFASAM